MGIENLTPDAINKLANWADTVLKNPKTRPTALRMTKEVNPNFRHAELEVETRLAAEGETRDKQLLEIRTELESEKIQRARDKKTQELKGQGFDIEAVEKVMTDNHIGSYETAMKFMQQEAQLAPTSNATSQFSSGVAEMPEDFKDIRKNPVNWARKKAADIMNQFRRGEITA